MCQLLTGSRLCRAGVPYGTPGRFVLGVGMCGWGVGVPRGGELGLGDCGTGVTGMFTVGVNVF